LFVNVKFLYVAECQRKNRDALSEKFRKNTGKATECGKVSRKSVKDGRES